MPDDAYSWFWGPYISITFRLRVEVTSIMSYNFLASTRQHILVQ